MQLSTPYFLKYLIGRGSDFAFRKRFFHVICASSAIGALFISGIHFLIDFDITAKSLVLLGLFLGFSLVLSRFLNAHSWGLTVFGVSSATILYYTYLRTGGIQGEALYGLLIVYLTLVLICRKTMRLPLTVMFIALLGSLFYMEQLQPQLISNYSIEAIVQNELYSFASIFVSLGFISYAALTFLWEEFLLKNQEAKTQLAEIEKQNHIINTKISELEETNQQKDRLFSIIGHDLRNPLASIEGYLDALDHGLDEEDQDHIKDQLLNLVQNSRGLLDNLVKWAKKDNQARFETLNAKDIALDAIATLKPIAANKGISINVLMDEDDALVVADRNMLEMVIRNLVSNAIKFTRDGGWIKIRAYTHSDFIALEVEDNGVGMSEKQRQRLFTPEKLIHAGTNAEKGVGLGLLLCKEFVEKMKGAISCTSQQDKGSNFKVILPIPNTNFDIEKEQKGALKA